MIGTITVTTMNLVILLMVISSCSSSPTSTLANFRSGGRDLNSATYLCKDSDGTYYNLGDNIKRRRDGWICKCARAGQGTRFTCRSPLYRGNTGTQSSSFGQIGTSERERSFAADHCVYNGRFYDLNSEWQMRVNGVTMDCRCDNSAHLRCQMATSSSSSRTYRPTGGQPISTGDTADDKCLSATFRRGEYFAIRQPGGYYSLCTCSGNAATCQVLTVSTEECRFPFEDNGRYYSTCTSSNPLSAPHCITSEFGVNPPVFTDCITSIEELNVYYSFVFTYGGNANGARCHFPFRVRGVLYDRCTTTPGRRQKWCATTSDYDTDGRYGYCQEGYTQPEPTSSSSIFNRVGEPVVIECKYDRIKDAPPPTITWYKVTDSGRQKLFTYYAATQTGVTAPTAGVYLNRISMPNARELVINNMRLEDAGTFECDVRYAAGYDLSGRTDVSIVGETSPSLLRYVYTLSSNRVTFYWVNPTELFDGIRLEYQQEGSTVFHRATLPPGRSSFSTRRLRPGATYEVRVFTITDGRDSTPATLTFTVPVVSQTRAGSLNGDAGENTPTAAQPLAQPQVTGNDIALNWLSNPFTETEVTGWLVSYRDASTGKIENVTLSSSTNSHILRDLHSGQRYRVTVYAMLDNNQVEVGSTDVVTEFSPIEILQTPRVTEPRPRSLTLSWEPPASDDIILYEVAYRDSDNLRGRWTSFELNATPNPTTTLRNLSPGTSYDIRVTPITPSRRGSPILLSATTNDDTRSGPIGQPRNLRFTDIGRSSFIARWEAPNDGNDIRTYRVRFQPYPLNGNDVPTIRTTYRPYFYVSGLDAGQEYIFQVSSVSDDDESEPASNRVTTPDEVCFVDNVWRGEGEEFYKLNSAGGYLQNCTCHRKEVGLGGRWECDPILCAANDGSQYTVEATWDQLHNEGNHYETCSCTINGSVCRYKEAVLEPQEQVIRRPLGGRIVLECPHETVASTRPTILWNKITATGKVPLYSYDGATRRGRATVEAGQMHGRISMDNEVDFVIQPLRGSDAGTYECVITYPRNSQQPTTHQATLTVTPRSSNEDEDDGSQDIPAGTLTVPQVDGTTDTITITWEAPNDDVTSYIVEYTDENNPIVTNIIRVTSPPVVLEHLNPSTTYGILIIPVLAQGRGKPIYVTGTTDDEPAPPDETEAPPVATPGSPTNLRFDSIGKTSLRAVWNVPFAVTPQITGYKVEYTPHLTDETPKEKITRNRYLQTTGLQPGTAYLFRVYALHNEVESVPVSNVVTTDAIGTILVHASNRRRSDRIGSDASLTCRYNLNTPGKPVMTWSRLHRDGSITELATFDTSARIGEQFKESEEAGNYAGRLRSTHVTRLTISDLQASDDGNYQCVLTYPTGGGSGTTRVSIVGPPSPAVFTSPVISESESEHTLSWTVEPAPRVDNFILKVRRRGSTRKTYTEFTPPGGARSFLFRNLKPGRTYEGNIISRNRYGSSAPTDFHFTMTSSGQPQPPTGLVATESSPNEITVVVNGPMEDVDFNRIRYAPEDDEDNELVARNSRPSEPIVLTRLLANTPYLLKVISVNSNGESAPLKATLTTPRPLPSPPTGITLNELTPRSATLLISGGPTEGIDYYEVSYQPSSRITSKRTVRTNADEGLVTLVLEPVTHYEIEIASVNQYGKSPKLKTYITTPQEEVTPNRPLSFTSIVPRSDSVTLSWDGSTEGVQYYIIEYQTSEDREPGILSTPGTQQTIRITGLLPETTYNVRVKAVGPSGHSPYLIDTFDTTPAVRQPGDLEVTGSFDDEINFDVTGLDDDDADYFIVGYYPVGSPEEEIETEFRSPEITLTNLISGTTYRVTVIAVKGNERSRPVTRDFIPGEVEPVGNDPVITQTERPLAPESADLSVTGSLPDEINFDVTGLTDDADYFIIRFHPVDSPDEIIETTSYDADIALTGLIPGTTYRVTVIAVKDEEESRPIIKDIETSEPIGNDPIISHTEAPLAPESADLSVNGSLPNEINFDVTGLTDDADYFIIRFHPVDSPDEIIETTSYDADITLTGLIPGTTYRVTVIAVKDEEESRPIIKDIETSESVGNDPIISHTEAPLAPESADLSVNGSLPNEINFDVTGLTDDADYFLVSYYPVGSPEDEIKRRVDDSEIVLAGLVPDTTYRVTVIAVKEDERSRPITKDIDTSEAVENDPVLVVTEPTPSTRVATPTRIRLISREPKEVTFLIESPEELTATDYYQLSYTPTSREGPTKRKKVYGPGNQAELTKLVPVTRYHLLIKIVKPNSESETFSTYFITNQEKLSIAPTNLRPTDVQQTEATLTWEEPQDLGSIRRYLVEFGQTSRTDLPATRKHVSKANPFVTLSRLDPNTEYFVRVSSLGRRGEKSDSVSTQFTTLREPSSGGEEPVPDDAFIPRQGNIPKPTGLVVNRRQATEAELGWFPLENAQETDGYLVEYQPTYNRHGRPQNKRVLWDQTSVTLTDLTPGTEYQVKLYTVVEGRQSEPALASFMTNLNPPSNLHATPENNRLVVTWTNPEGPRVGTRFAYRIDDERWREQHLSIDKTSYIIPVDGTKNQKIDISVAALGGTIESLPVKIQVYSRRRPPTKALDLTFANVEDSTIDVQWQPPNEADPPVTGYIVKIEPTDSDEEPVLRQVQPQDLHLTVDNLHPGTSYDVSVTPIIPGAETEPITSQIETELPVPEDLQVTEVTETTIRVMWEQPNDEITDYYVDYRPTDSFDNFRQRVRGNTEITINNLMGDTEYVISVYSLYNNRRSEPATVTQSTRAQSVPEPSFVEVLDSESPAFDHSSISLRWSPDPSHSHLVVVKTESGDTVFEREFPDEDEATVTDLKPSTNYTIQVYAVDRDDSERKSAPVTTVQKTKPRKPSRLEVMPSGATSALVRWPVVDGDDITGYLLTYRPEGGELVEKIAKGNQAMLDDLQPLTNYQDFSIQTIADDMLSDPYIFPRTIRTFPLPEPRNVFIMRETGTNNHVITWQPIEEYEGTYEITYQPDDSAQPGTLPAITLPGATSHKFRDLLPAQRYTFKVFPSGSPVSDSTATKDYTTDIPAPETLSVSDITANTAVIGFDAPDYDRVTSYRIRVYPVSNPSSVIRHTVNPTDLKSVPLRGLLPGTRYQVEVITKIGSQSSPAKRKNFETLQRRRTTTPATLATTSPATLATTSSATPATTTPVAETPQAAPLESNQLENGNYSLKWPAYDGPLRHYKVIYTDRSGRESQQVIIPSDFTDTELTGLVSGEDYQLTVYAVLSNNEEIIVGTTVIEPFGNDRSAVIEWDGYTRSFFTKYRITATPRGNVQASVITREVPAHDTTIRLTELLPGTTYIVVVEGYDGHYHTLTEQTLHTAIDPPTNLQATRTLPTSIALEWEPPQAPIIRYSLTYQLDGVGSELTVVPSPRVSARSAILRNLIPGRQYVIRLYASSSNSDSQPAILWTNTAVPTPQRMKASHVTPNLIGIRWQEPADSVTHYTLRVVGPNEEVVLENLRLEPDSKSYIIRNLEPGTRYHVYLTAWIDNLHSQPAYSSKQTPTKVSNVVSRAGKVTDDGFLLSWKGKSRSVEGWKLEVLPQDGSEGFERFVSRFTKRYELDNLKPGIAYLVKIYPYSGTIYGTPSIVRIPASEIHTVTHTWRMQIPQVESDRVRLIWDNPFLNGVVSEYELSYKVQGEVDSAYQLVSPQPQPTDLTSTIRNLQPGQSYTIRLIARQERSELTAELLVDVTIPLPPPSDVRVESQSNGNVYFTWSAPSVRISNYVLKYRIGGSSSDSAFTEINISGDSTSYTLTSLEAGTTYEIQFYAVNGASESSILRLVVETVGSIAEECTDPATRQVYQVGQNWISKNNGFRMNCECRGPQDVQCNSGDWCYDDGTAYELNDTWRKEYDNNQKEVCVCERASYYQCYPRTCQESGTWYDDGATWISSTDGFSCSCECAVDVTQSCRYTCNPVLARNVENA